MKRPICPLCGVELNHATARDKDDKVIIVEEQIEIDIHNPRYIHEDVKVMVHKACHDKVKALYPNYDSPTQADWAAPKLPFIGVDGKVSLKDLKPESLEKTKDLKP